MTVHPMVPSDYTTPDGLRVLDDATRVGGALAGILAAVIAAGVTVRRWWHRRWDRQERVLREEMAALRDSLHERLDQATGTLGQRLDELHADVRQLRKVQDDHLTAHVTGEAS